MARETAEQLDLELTEHNDYLRRVGGAPPPGAEAPAPYRLRTPTPRDTAVVGRRAAQCLVDLVASSGAPVVLALLLVLVPIGDTASLGPVQLSVAAVLVGLVALGSYLWYWVIRPSRARGQTMGMRLAQVRVVAADGSPVGLGRLLVRWLLLPVDLALVGLVSMAVGRYHQRLGDRLAGTVVIRD
ncbi:putative RDD family membrane protein YckC [Allonocardiopsis opalescens]|uniref:Putative RDD family membrane protein YckC n=1 Tax=Allonocardiopsis opalescens TaxID=1144618 RepID=A0A2T0QAM3_9ACTN|nr:putative RDD family membrane protein YckC [Allonocardiopsis opalescens]